MGFLAYYSTSTVRHQALIERVVHVLPVVFSGEGREDQSPVRPHVADAGMSRAFAPSRFCQLTWGVGTPSAEQRISAPLLLENSILKGGSTLNLGPTSSSLQRTQDRTGRLKIPILK
ncbi:hypothetical protein CEXT_293121 [Caerostris extrusa]|uniref:Uncharacterized protein n=1 Tax=Caerostris extrusa TaxID=172846 RepID=A0AAV4T2V8_CAEEX|nr:hypothetical protein CEXT_293121 [Caerostris extrusa]